jgi:hypothetical protein
MAQQTLSNGKTGLVIRTALNDMLTELYAEVDDLQEQIDGKSDSGHSHDSAYEPIDSAIQEHITSDHADPDANYYVHPTYHNLSMISGAGTAAAEDVGTTEGDVVQLDATGLPAVDGSQVTNLSAENITEGTTAKVLTSDERDSIAANVVHTATVSGNPHAVTATDINLGNVDNTADTNKPVSTAQQTAIDLKVDIADIVDDLVTGGTAVPLSAAQGVTLSEKFDSYYTSAEVAALLMSYDTSTEVAAAIAESEVDLSGYYTSTEVAELLTDYYTSTETDSAISTALESYYSSDDVDGLITALADVYAKLTGGGQVLQGHEIRDYSESAYDHGSVSSGTVSLTYEYPVNILTLTGDVTIEVDTSTAPDSGEHASIMLKLIGGDTYTVTWSGITADDDFPDSFVATERLVVMTEDAGTTNHLVRGAGWS